VLRADPQKLELTKRAGTIRWQLKLKHNQSETLTYEYERYVRSG